MQRKTRKLDMKEVWNLLLLELSIALSVVKKRVKRWGQNSTNIWTTSWKNCSLEGSICQANQQFSQNRKNCRSKSKNSFRVYTKNWSYSIQNSTNSFSSITWVYFFTILLKEFSCQEWFNFCFWKDKILWRTLSFVFFRRHKNRFYQYQWKSLSFIWQITYSNIIFRIQTLGKPYQGWSH